MDAVEFIKTVNRMYPCDRREALNFAFDNPEQAVVRVERWAKDHPVKTRQSEFLKRFPNAMINKSDGVLCITPCSIEGESIGCINGKSCGDCRREYWSEEVNN